MIEYFRITALALVGAMMTGCSGSDDSIAEEPQPPVNTGNIVTLTTTVSFDDGATTRALTIDNENYTGVKTFAAGDQIAVSYYSKTSGEYVKAVSEALQDNGDITNSGKNATFTVTLDNPDKTKDVIYVYPVAMLKDNLEYNFDALYNNQNGTLANLGSKFDLCTKQSPWNGTNLPSLTLDNKFAILAITLKDATGANDITNTIEGLTISDGANSYNVTREAADGPIYVAIRPTTSADITVTATAGIYTYTKSLSAKTYDAGNGYNVSWRMTQQLAVIRTDVEPNAAVTKGGDGTYQLTSGATTYSISGVGDGNLQGVYSTLNIAAGTVIGGYVSLNEYYINLLGDATIKGDLIGNGVTSGHVCHISGSGTLTVEGDLEAIVHLTPGVTLRVKGDIHYLSLVKNAAGTADITPTTDGDYKVYITPAISTMKLTVPLWLDNNKSVWVVGVKFNTQSDVTTLNWEGVEYDNNFYFATFKNIAVPSGATTFDVYLSTNSGETELLTGIDVAEEVRIEYENGLHVVSSN